MNFRSLVLGFTLCTSLQTLAVETQKPTLLAISKTDHILAFINLETLEIKHRVPVGADPHEVVVSSDGKFAYVSNTGSGKYHEINVIDIVNHKALPNIDTGALLGPHGLAYVGDKLWFTAEGAKSFGRYDPVSKEIDLIMGVGENRTHMIYVKPDSKEVYVSNVDSGNVSIFENLMLPPPIPPIGAPLPTAKPAMGWLQTVISAQKGAEGFAVSPSGEELWIANAHAGTVSIIDLKKRKVSKTVDTKTLGISRAAFTPDGKRILVSSLRTGDLLIYDTATKKLLKKLNLGKGAAHILINGDGSKAYVSCTPAHKIVIIDLAKQDIAGEINIGERPDGMDFTK